MGEGRTAITRKMAAAEGGDNQRQGDVVKKEEDGDKDHARDTKIMR